MNIFTQTPQMLDDLMQSAHKVIRSESELESNCCGGAVLGADSNGHGTCSDCKENCVGEKDLQQFLEERK